ncbi:hypothetical protein A2Y99_05365 [Candidatus Gottesmanbacteria bacterium RBG_13_37_7]|uniref:Uncharacterized protein n=1 Tax=Candidatus Gottesmanbacteria bacterium RBG_13_37_7 TaxID=1798369 RepID=A0A1F5YL76_9BACT|nr:MAG: hypothetical protein A2Y99_05365 [Candidatus Gottesmanbacteria bacterium RBG_13_37_7]
MPFVFCEECNVMLQVDEGNVEALITTHTPIHQVRGITPQFQVFTTIKDIPQALMEPFFRAERWPFPEGTGR